MRVTRVTFDAVLVRQSRQERAQPSPSTGESSLLRSRLRQPGQASSLTDAQVAALRKARIQVGGGWQDPSHAYHADEASLLTGLGVPAAPGFSNGGHSWFVWRLDLGDFLTRTAFFPPAAG
ncbi:hypothetical protein [Streptomyces aurantiacus]|uniref:hypothetical protein n=1 Tax=Streptomyces aurantiacus TaxID=47760 RepID=UPI000A87060E